MIRVDHLTAGFQSRTVLHDVCLDIPEQGILGLMGPGGVGKSTLLRTLGRWNDRLLSFWFEGSIYFGERDLLRDCSVDDVHRTMPLLAQKARLYTSTILDNAIAEIARERPFTLDEKEEIAHGVLAPWDLWDEFKSVLLKPVLSLSIGRQRKLSIARLMANGSFLLADEPLRDISRREAGEIEDLLRLVARNNGILMVTHNQRIAHALCDQVYFMDAGRIVEGGATELFISMPGAGVAIDLLRKGTSSLEPEQNNGWGSLNEDADSENTAGEHPDQGAGEHNEDRTLPGGFHWILPGHLAGMQQPGLLYNEEDELKSLQALGCTDVITLREQPYTPGRLESFGLRGTHFPIRDMCIPGLDDAIDLSRRLSRWVDQGRCVVLHCKAGLGRTGTMLACVLVVRGFDAVQAIHEVRSINPYYIQSEEQLAFIGRFSEGFELAQLHESRRVQEGGR